MDSDRSFIALMGHDWLDVLFPSWKKWFLNENIVNSVRSNQFLVKQFGIIECSVNSRFSNTVANNVGQSIVGFSAEIVLREDAPPIFHFTYSVPFKLREKVDQ